MKKMACLIVLTFFLTIISFDGFCDEINPAGLKLSFEIQEKGLNYEVYGESVISQDKLKEHSVFNIANLPKEAIIKKAFLYWAGEREGHKSAGTKIEMKDPDRKNHIIHAEKIWTNVVSGLLYICRTDVTDKIKGNGKYEISFIEADPLEPVTFGEQVFEKAHYTIGGWSLVVIYSDPKKTETANIQILDGMFYIASGEALRTGIYGDKKIGHDISKESVYPYNKVFIDMHLADRGNMLDMTIVSGFGHPLDGGSVLLDGDQLTGWEDFVANAGWAWDINRNIVLLKDNYEKPQYELEIKTDYNSILPILFVVREGSIDDQDILKLASSYILRADDVGEKPFYDTRDPDNRRKEYAAKRHIRNILNTKALDMIKGIADRGIKDPYELHMELGELYLGQRRYEIAKKQLDLACEISSDAYQPYYHLGRLHYRKREIDQAIDLFETARKKAKDNISILHNLGTCYLQKGLLSKAINNFEQILRIDRDNIGALTSLLEIYESQHRLQDKVRIFKLIDEIKERKKE